MDELLEMLLLGHAKIMQLQLSLLLIADLDILDIVFQRAT
jgi:hypothetical protein